MIKKTIILIIAAALLFLNGCAGSPGNTVKSEMLDLYGENSEVTGEYDESLAVECNNGIFIGLENNGVISHKGVPYAEAPVGSLRWKPPVAAKDRSGVFEAYYFGASPVQTEWPSEVGSYYPQSEDCLTLNVWSNAEGPADGRAVMVFFHGGSYGWGATSDPIYDGQNLIKKFPDIILVTVEYRLGILGFIDFSSVPGGEEYKESGNLGLLDQICALRWIQKNVSAFGGDPDNVTIFGESAGAGSVSLLPLIKEADGLYRRVIAESGSVALTYSKDECRNLTRMLIDESGCSTMDELKALTEDEIIEINKKLNDYNNFPERDGVVLPEDLYGAYERGETADTDMLIGTNADETLYWINEMGYYVSFIPGLTVFKNALPIMYENNLKRLDDDEKALVNEFMEAQSGGKAEKMSAFYNELLFRIPAMKQAELHAKSGNKVYTYHWTMPGENELTGACHAIELIYVFNNPQVTIYNGNLFNSDLADKVQNMWVNFARTGSPDTDNITWEQYDSESRLTMILGENIGMERDLMSENRQLIEPILGFYFNGCYSQLDYAVPQVFRLAALLLAVIILTAGMAAGIIICVKKKKRGA